MAVATYNTDLELIVACEAGDAFEEFTGYELGDVAAVETDWYIQGNACASDEANNKSGVGHSIGFDYGSNITFDTDDCFFAWMMCQMPNAPDTIANGGYRMLVGATIGDYNGWFVGGSDFGRNPYGGWVNVVVDPTYTPVDHTLGSPGAYRHFAIAFNLVNTTLKGRPLCADVMRYGRGDLYVEHGESGAYGTFAGMAAANDDQSARWGLFQEQAGGYLWKGLISLGTSASGVEFVDSNRNIVVDVTPRTYEAFNKIEINNADSVVSWTGISISSLDGSSLSPGQLEVVDNADVDFDSCTFTDMDTFIFKPNSTINSTVFRRCEQVTQGDGVFTGCTFDSSAPLYADDLENITYCDFTSSGTGHGMELTVTGTYTFTGNTFTSYGVSGTLDAALYNNSGGYILLNVEGGGDVPTYRNGAGASTDVQAAVTLTLTDLIANSEVRIYAHGTTTELDGIENCITTFEYTYQYAASTYVDIVVLHIDYEYYRINNYLLASTAVNLPIAQRADRWYANP